MNEDEYMNLDPQKVFIGVIDFFSVLMPGGFLSYLIRPWIAAHILGNKQFLWATTEGWVVLFFCSYLLGHFIFLLGSILDQRVYDPIRKLAYLGQIDRLARGKRLSHRWLRWFAETKLLFSKGADKAVIQIERMKANSLWPIEDKGVINAFQWCKAVLSLQHPQGLVAVQRLEADSKFFRSFVVVSGLLFVSYLAQLKFELVAVYFGMLLMALLRYVDQRSKASQQAYWLVLVHETFARPSDVKIGPLPRDDGLTHAGGVVFRRVEGEIRYLLIEASSDREIWVLPKGHIEAGEDPRQTAVREVKEETGHWARIVRWVDDAVPDTAPEYQSIRFYLMELDEESKTGSWPQENRQGRWLKLDDAMQAATLPWTSSFLEVADSKRRDIEKLKLK